MTLRAAGRTLSQSREHHRARNLLIVMQVALALILMVGSGLMIRTSWALRLVDPGFSNAEALETVHLGIPTAQVPDPERVLRMEEDILRKLESIGGVSAVAVANVTPLEGGGFNNPTYMEGVALPEGAVPPIRRYKYISPGYISTIGSRLIAGREFTWAELYRRAPLAMISENMAREVWGDPRAAVGKRIRATLKDDWCEVTGVIADLHDEGVDKKAPAIVYWPLLQKSSNESGASVTRAATYFIRTPRAGSSALRREVQQAVASVNASLPLADVRTLDEVYRRSMARTSLTLVLLTIAGGMALLIGVVGLYGVISYSVSQRTREIGIRIALGAPFQNVIRLFVGHGVVLSSIGVACGVVAALALARVMKSLLFEVSPADPLTFTVAPALLILAAALASYLPARKATSVDPMSTLRAE